MKPKYESKKVQKDEEKYLKKGGAPKSLQKHEKAEHRAMNKGKK